MHVYGWAGLALFAPALFMLAASAEAQAETQSGVGVVRLAEPLTVDGSLADWPGAAPIAVDSTMTADDADVTGDNDLSLEVWTAYDDAHFYLVRTRAPWHARGLTARDWESLMWTLPAVQLGDRAGRHDQQQEGEDTRLDRQRPQPDHRPQRRQRSQRDLLVTQHARDADHAAIEDRESEQ